MSGWKLQCYFCSDTVSTIKLSKEYYLMHLVAVHNIQQQGDRVLQWILAQQGVGQVPGGVTAQKSEKVSLVEQLKICWCAQSHYKYCRETITTG